MPDSELSALTEQTAPADDDILYLCNAAGTIDRKIKVSTIRKGAACRANRITSVQSIPTGAYTAIALNGETFDDASYHDTVTNNSRMTIPVTGRYRIEGQVQFEATSFTGSRVVTIWKNGVGTGTRIGQNFKTANPSYGTRSQVVSGVIELTAADYIEMSGYQDSGANLDIGFGVEATWLSIERVD